MTDRPVVSSVSVEIGEWRRSERSAESPPPHRAAWDQSIGPIALDVVWADKEKTRPVAVRDWDGCEALVKPTGAPTGVRAGD